MLTTDNIIFEILTDAKDDGNELLNKFHIGYPSKKLTEESNAIYVATVSSEVNNSGFDFQDFTDLVEILITTKIRDYERSQLVIKTVCTEITKLILNNHDKFPNKPVVRTITPELNKDYVLTRGHLMVQVKTEPINLETDEATITHVCNIIDRSDKDD